MDRLGVLTAVENDGAGTVSRRSNMATQRQDSERLRADARETPLKAGKPGVPGTAGWVPERREHAAPEPLISRATLADVPWTGLSFQIIALPPSPRSLS
jgi:hypothetical protein